VAQKLCITDAAVSQYLSSKRGKIVLKDPKIRKYIKDATQRIINGKQNDLFVEICKICDQLKNTKLLTELYKEYGDGMMPKNIKNLKC
jgi:predicted transcriptional regulator